MQSLSVKTQVRQYIVDQVLGGDGRGLTDETELLQSGILDSFLVFEFIVFLEETFNCKLPIEQIDEQNRLTINAITRLIEDELASKKEA